MFQSLVPNVEDSNPVGVTLRESLIDFLHFDEGLDVLPLCSGLLRRPLAGFSRIVKKKVRPGWDRPQTLGAEVGFHFRAAKNLLSY